MNAIHIEGLRKTYGAVRALDGLDLSVPAGSVFGFLGPNGAGKTTTVRILAGLAAASGGRAWVDGLAVGQGEIRRKIGYLPEEPAFYPYLTPRETLRDLIAPLFGLRGVAAARRADELLERVGLAEAANRRIAGFSRGMRQRLGLAQALIHRPPVLLLDEPASALDPAGRKEVLDLIESLRGETTVFMSTHILADVERTCDTVAILNKGRLVTQSGRAELLARYAAPVLEVRFEAAPEAVRAWADGLSGQSGIVSASAAGEQVRLTVSDPARGKIELPGQVAASGLPVLRYEWAQPSLEEVFLQLVGERDSPQMSQIDIDERKNPPSSALSVD